MITESFPAVVVGSGLAGLTAALSLGPLRTLVLTKTDAIIGGSTPWAQGGVAFPRDPADAPVHVADTIVSGAGHTDPQAAETLVAQAPGARTWLESQGVAFDRDATGNYQYGREGAHSARRILHVGADGTGAGLARTLAARVTGAAHVTVRTRTFVVRLLPGGLLTFEEDRGLVLVLSPRIILAGGGLGQLFDATTAPAEATGDTMALALEAGARITDLEMVQFHPTALAVRPAGSPNLSLLTEALRGEGAVLVTADDENGAGLHPLDTGHPLGSLGPRDVLSRAIFHRKSAGYPVWLDARGLAGSSHKFPTVTRLCAEVGLDPSQDLLPVVPAVHYTMGGVACDAGGRTSLPGVWAAGETSRTGVHGANRLASNSLLECVVWGRAAADDARQTPQTAEVAADPVKQELVAQGWALWRLPSADFAARLRPALQAVMGQAAGPVRTAAGLEAGLETFRLFQSQWDKAASGGRPLGELTFRQVRTILEVRHLLLLGPAVLTQALARRESLGAHHRGD